MAKELRLWYNSDLGSTERKVWKECTGFRFGQTEFKEKYTNGKSSRQLEIPL